MQKPKYKIPKNLCQVCYEVSGRYILDCYCIICQQCYNRHFHLKGTTCQFCGRQTKGNKIDAKQQSSIKKIGHLFENFDVGMNKMLEIYKFQNEITNRYCQHLEKELYQYHNAVNQLISINPNLYNFFSARVKVKGNSMQTQQYDRNHSVSIKGEPTIKPNREYASQIFESRRTTLDMNPPISKNSRTIEMNGIRAIGRNHQNHSGNIIYKVPNLNVNTAIRSSKRILKEHSKIPPQYDEDIEYYRYRKQ